MTLPHYAAYKLGAWGVGIAGGALFAFFQKDVATSPSILLYGAAIVTIPPTITGLFGIWLQARSAKRVEHKVDGILTAAHAGELAATKRADFADGRREGIEAQQDRGRP